MSGISAARATAGEEDADSSKVRQILDGARDVFLRLGFDGASMGDVARAAGVSKGTLYVYFENKSELFSALIADERRHAHAFANTRSRAWARQA